MLIVYGFNKEWSWHKARFGNFLKPYGAKLKIKLYAFCLILYAAHVPSVQVKGGSEEMNYVKNMVHISKTDDHIFTNCVQVFGQMYHFFEY